MCRVGQWRVLRLQNQQCHSRLLSYLSVRRICSKRQILLSSTRQFPTPGQVLFTHAAPMTATGIRRGYLSIAQRLLHRSGSQAACSNATALRSQTASLSTTSGDPSAQREQEITQLLKERMPGAKAVRVQDTSGGCGSMYRIAVAADEFK